MDRTEFNQLKDKVMTSIRYITEVYEGGLENCDQFESFAKMCENYVDMCNKLCERLKPTLRWVQYRKMKLYKEFHDMCSDTVTDINGFVSDWKCMYDKAVEDAKWKAQLEERCRIEHEIAIEYRKKEEERLRKEEDKRPRIGFKTSYNTPKKKGRKKKTE